ncbi:Substance-K receptor [Exaiptasia diaphana]|nr:Substance-K receptor [Exaiptasia diaphana]
MRTRHAFYIIIAIWTGAILVATPMLYFAKIDKDGACIENLPMIGSVQLVRVYTYFIFVALYVLPLGAISGLYFMIYLNLMHKAPLQKTADRHRAIVHPLKPRMRTRHAFYIIIAIWTGAILVATPMLYFAKIDKDGACIENLPMIGSVQLVRVYTYFIFVALYVLPLGAISGLYFMIYLNLMHKAPLQKSAHRARVSVVRMLIMVVVVFALCWLPYHAVFLDPGEIDQTKLYAVYFGIWLASANSSFNPIIYAVFNLNYRREFARILTCGTINVGKYLGWDTSTDDPRTHVSIRKSHPMEKMPNKNGENMNLVDDGKLCRGIRKQELNGNNLIENERSSLPKHDEEQNKYIAEN